MIFNKIMRTIVLTVIILLFYVLWTGSFVLENVIIMGISGFVVALIYASKEKFPVITFKKIIYSVAYIFYMIKAIAVANFDVARRVIQPKIPINPGIVAVKTRLKSNVGKMILANSITLTPGTLTVDIDGDHLYIHWIDVTDIDEEMASKDIVQGFEKYLEVIFG